ncbi:unnamed protein product [Acanthoscelides obtectus]|uniref:Uncharacterized protein n=1 Tax=Acanthoscelides obtectus TaxID=200917 RepID=A0A9P0Q7M0_ACAOB|nr:unnamed protein product [Acanthoscelides obtectus]CAK1666761.1 hypothetical protein AOBTE_LOCUS25473 [Acanthoscelides obtectus]
MSQVLHHQYHQIRTLLILHHIRQRTLLQDQDHVDTLGSSTMSWNGPPGSQYCPAPGYGPGPTQCNCGPPSHPGEAKRCHCMPPGSFYPGPPMPGPPGPSYVPGAVPYPSAPPSCTIVPAPAPPSCTIVPAPQASRPCGHTGLMYGCSHCDAVRHHRY